LLPGDSPKYATKQSGKCRIGKRKARRTIIFASLDIETANPSRLASTCLCHQDFACTDPSVPDPNLAVEVWALSEMYLFQFRDMNAPEGSKGKAEEILEKMGLLDEYSFCGNGKFQRTKTFAFPSEEQTLYDYISDFNAKLAKMPKSV
jgi:hypothetical protein